MWGEPYNYPAFCLGELSGLQFKKEVHEGPTELNSNRLEFKTTEEAVIGEEGF